MEARPNYYHILEVDKTAQDEEIKAAFRRLARQHHPDLNGEGSETKMQELNTAYEVLRDPMKRRLYNRALSSRPGERFRMPYIGESSPISAEHCQERPAPAGSRKTGPTGFNFIAWKSQSESTLEGSGASLAGTYSQRDSLSDEKSSEGANLLSLVSLAVLVMIAGTFGFLAVWLIAGLPS